MFELEMNNEKELFICGCKGILAYTDEKITLDTGGPEISVRGENISMLSYADGDIYIIGTIMSIEFEQKSEVVRYEKKAG